MEIPEFINLTHFLFKHEFLDSWVPQELIMNAPYL